MSIAETVYKSIDRIPPGKIFGYEVFPEYQKAPEAVVRAVGRRVDRQELKRLEKGRFYTPKQGILGEVPVGDAELVRNVLYSKGKRCGYITGPALYNRWGLTTQIPKTISIAANRSAQTKDFGTIRIKIVPKRAPINDSTVPLLEILDVFRDAKKVPDARVASVIGRADKTSGRACSSQTEKVAAVCRELLQRRRASTTRGALDSQRARDLAGATRFN